MVQRTGTAHYEGLGKKGKGRVSVQSGVLKDARYDFNTRFEQEPGTNPEELVAAAHAACFTMALSFALAEAGYADGTLDTKAAVTLEKDGEGFTVTKSALTLSAAIPGIAQAEFDQITQGAKANCPISKLLKAEITLDATLQAS
jgi:osmotically inducible protein OsmC